MYYRKILTYRILQITTITAVKLKMIIEGVADRASPGKQLGDVIGRHINLRKGAQCEFYS